MGAHPRRREGSSALAASTSSWSRSSVATRSSGRYSLGSEDLDAAEAEDQGEDVDMVDGAGNADGNDDGGNYDQLGGGGTNSYHRSEEDFFAQSKNYRSQESKQELGYYTAANARPTSAYLLADTQPSRATTAIVTTSAPAAPPANTTPRFSTLETVDHDKAMTTGLGTSSSSSSSSISKQALNFPSSSIVGGDRNGSKSLTRSGSAQLSTTGSSYGNIPTNPTNANRSSDNANHIIASNSANTNSNSRMEEILPNGAKLIRYANGTTKEISHDGRSAMVRFTNGDYKHTDTVSGVVIYYYKLADTTHTTYKDGMEVYEFPNKQVFYNRSQRGELYYIL